VTAKARASAKSRRWTLIVAIGLGVLALALAAAWKWTPLHELVNPSVVSAWLKDASDERWMPLLVAAVYVAASLVMFPNTVLCLAVILTLGPIAGTAYAFGGSMVAALVGYSLGRWGGKRIEKLRLRAVDKVGAKLRKGGGFAQVLTIRILPVAPFSVTNIVSGAAHVRLLPFLSATALGIAPYILAFGMFGRQTRRLFTHPTLADGAGMLAIVVVLGLATWWAHSRVKRG